ncbi:ATP-grasp domain-containing protein [Campylobacter vicugnae]|uniref:ATP-grasp domain-containing protein n=1 Tax=Campylobacter vicugnae TaxID=1660076 RepID=A0A1X9T0H7_9BACT|nr:ATP-grasp domain-containing protein [Campylobacter sp. RM8964]ARR02044.1 ATP-grasp domain-containing protein [Campylobacter sp. RM8964]
MNQNKIALIIGANSESIIAIKHAKALGLKVIAFDANPKAPGLKEADISYNIDIINPSNIIQTLSKENITPDIILPVPIGRYLITIGALNDYYNLNGFSYKMADICTDKLKFASALVDNGGGCKHIKNLRDSNSLLFRLDLDLNQFKFPLIIKPRFGSGSRDVLVLTTADELKEIYKNDKFTKEDFLIEEFINGIEYGLDAVVIDGKFHHILIREKQITSLPYRQAIANISIDEIPAISIYMQKIINRLQIDNYLLNADLIITQDGRSFIIELATRPSGHYLSKFIEITTGINPTKEWINKSLNLPYNFKPKFRKNTIMRYFDFEGDWIAADFDLLKDSLGIIDYRCEINSTLPKVIDGSTIMDRGYAIIEANSKEECIKNANKLISNFKRIKR